MSAHELLSRLARVRRTAGGWRADCPNPVHAHVQGSLSITEAEDGRVLLHCFACSDTYAVLAAVGLELADLFPERIKDPSPEAVMRSRDLAKRSRWEVALSILEREATVVLIAASFVRNGQLLSDSDDDRLLIAIQRIDDARMVLS